MWLLFISDTHGKLGIINESVAQVRVDAVIHTGDFSFFDNGSFERRSDGELRLHVVHSDLPRTERDRILALSRKGMIRIAGEHLCRLSQSSDIFFLIILDDWSA